MEATCLGGGVVFLGNLQGTLICRPAWLSPPYHERVTIPELCSGYKLWDREAGPQFLGGASVDSNGPGSSGLELEPEEDASYESDPVTHLNTFPTTFKGHLTHAPVSSLDQFKTILDQKLPFLKTAKYKIICVGFEPKNQKVSLSLTLTTHVSGTQPIFCVCVLPSGVVKDISVTS